MLDYLRCPVLIEDESGTRKWWGYVNGVTLRNDAWSVGATLDGMYNAVAVAYSLAQTGVKTIGQRKTTAWATGADSVSDYGRKEFLSSQGSLSDDMATARRDDILRVRQKPQGSADPSGSLRRRGRRDSWQATILCLGWWSTLNWRYASIDAVPGLTYATTSATEQAVGAAAANQKVAEIVNLGGRAMNALGLEVYARKQGSPTDNLVLSLYAVDENDVPKGSSLGTISLAGSGLSASLAWVSGTFSSEKQLDPATDYALVVSRSGSVDGTNYYVVNVNTDCGFTSGFLRIYDGSSWGARSPDADLPFVITVNNNVESTAQVKELALTFGEFITGVDVEEASGLLLPSYRDGDTLVGDEIKTLLESGGANGRRLLASIESDRRLRVWEEPESTSPDYLMNQDGDLLDHLLNPVRNLGPVVGSWVRLHDVIPGSVDLGKLNTPELQFVEAATWTPDGGFRPQFRGQPSVDDLFKVKR